jgi:hypothetical protein
MGEVDPAYEHVCTRTTALDVVRVYRKLIFVAATGLLKFQ